MSENRNKMQFAILTFLFFIYLYIGSIILSHYFAVSTIDWMKIYSVSDFQTFPEVINFYKTLLIPIPVNISLVEFVEFLLFGTSSIVTGYFYRIGILLLFCPFIFKYWKSVPHFLLSIIFSIFSILWIAIIHYGNPQLYDIFFPLFVVFAFQAYIYLWNSKENKRKVFWAFATGFLLSMAEMSRPFFIFILVIFTFFFLLKYIKDNKLVVISYLLPLLLFSGIWHLYIYIQHDQIAASNHSGFNLYRAWNEYVDYPDLIPEIHNEPLVADRWENLNTQEHLTNSNILSWQIGKYIIHHPFESSKKIVKDYVNLFWEPETGIYSYQPEGKILEIYVWIIRGFAIFLVLAILFMVYKLFSTHVKKWYIFFSQPAVQLIFVIISSSLITTIGESGEEARFLVSIYPMIVYLFGIIFPYQKEKNERKKIFSTS